MMNAQERDAECLLPESPDVNVGDLPIKHADPVDIWQFTISVECFQKPDSPDAFHCLRDASVRFEDGSVVVVAHDMFGSSEAITLSDFAAQIDIEKCTYSIDLDGQAIGVSVYTRTSAWATQSKSSDRTDTGTTATPMLDQITAHDDCAKGIAAPGPIQDEGQPREHHGEGETRHGFSSYANFL